MPAVFMHSFHGFLRFHERMTFAPRQPVDHRPKFTLLTVLFVTLHLACFTVFLMPFHWGLLAMLVVTYGVRMFAITGGYHRYFAHRTYRLNRFNQFVLAFIAQTSAQKGVLWWASHHRDHHKYSDTEKDIHSPVTQGLWWSHVGWVISDTFDDYDQENIQDFEKFPELRFLSRYHWICPWLMGIASFAFGEITGLGGWATLVWGFVLSTVLLFHCTFSINSLSHLWGTRRFETKDDSRNNLLLALLTLGEGWHNNHHHYQSSCRQGIRWWEVDVTFYILKVLSWVGIVRDIRPYPLSARKAA
jgi:stearoyl-CoA desaturase (Delta-9 desaturase)